LLSLLLSGQRGWCERREGSEEAFSFVTALAFSFAVLA